jgi:hypothetical protein
VPAYPVVQATPGGGDGGSNQVEVRELGGSRLFRVDVFGQGDCQGGILAM